MNVIGYIIVIGIKNHNSYDINNQFAKYFASVDQNHGKNLLPLQKSATDYLCKIT